MVSRFLPRSPMYAHVCARFWEPWNLVSHSHCVSCTLSPTLPSTLSASCLPDVSICCPVVFRLSPKCGLPAAVGLPDLVPIPSQVPPDCLPLVSHNSSCPNRGFEHVSIAFNMPPSPLSSSTQIFLATAFDFCTFALRLEPRTARKGL